MVFQEDPPEGGRAAVEVEAGKNITTDVFLRKWNTDSITEQRIFSHYFYSFIFGYVSYSLPCCIHNDLHRMENQTPSLQTVPEIRLPGFKILFREARDLYRTRFLTIAGIMAVAGGMALLVFALFFAAARLLLGSLGGFDKTFAELFQQASGSMSAIVLAVIIGYIIFLCIVGALFSWFFASFLSFLHSQSTASIGVVDSYREGAKKLRSMWWVGLLSVGMIVGSSLFFVIPGIALNIFLMFAVYVLVFEDIKGFTALYASYQLVRGAWWKVFGRLIVLGIVAFFVMLVLGLFLGFLIPLIIGVFGLPANISKVVVMIVMMVSQLLIAFFISPCVPLFVSRIYAALKATKTIDLSRKPSPAFRVVATVCILVSIGCAIGYPLFIISTLTNVQHQVSSQSSILSNNTSSNETGLTPKMLEDIRGAREADLTGFPNDPDFFTPYKPTEESQHFSLLMPKKWEASSLIITHTLQRKDGVVRFKIDKGYSGSESSRKTVEELAKDSIKIYKDALGADDPFDMGATTIGGKPAYTYSIRQTIPGLSFQYMVSFVVFDKETNYEITASALQSDFEFYKPVFQKMIESFTFTAGQ